MKTKKNRLILLISVGLFWAGQHIFTPYQTTYMTAIGITADIAGIVVGAYGFTQMILRFPIGVNADRKAKHKPFITVGFICIVAASTLRIFAKKALLFLIANLLAGVGSSMWISFTILFSNMFTEEELKNSISLIMSFNHGGCLFAYLLGIAIYPILGAKYLFLASIILSVFGLLMSCMVKEDDPQLTLAIDLRLIVKEGISGRLILFSILALILQAVCQSTQSSFTSQVAKNLGATSEILGALSIVTMVFQLIGSGILQFNFMKKIKIEVLIVADCILFGLYSLLVGLAGSVTLVFIAQAIGAMSNAQLSSLYMASAIEGCPTSSKSTAMGFYQAVYGIGMTVGPVIMGTVAEKAGYTIGFTIMACFMLADVVLYLIFGRKKN